MRTTLCGVFSSLILGTSKSAITAGFIGGRASNKDAARISLLLTLAPISSSEFIDDAQTLWAKHNIHTVDPDASPIDGPLHFRGWPVPTPALFMLKSAPSPMVIASQCKGEPEDWSRACAQCRRASPRLRISAVSLGCEVHCRPARACAHTGGGGASGLPVCDGPAFTYTEFAPTGSVVGTFLMSVAIGVAFAALTVIVPLILIVFIALVAVQVSGDAAGLYWHSSEYDTRYSTLNFTDVVSRDVKIVDGATCTEKVMRLAVGQNAPHWAREEGGAAGARGLNEVSLYWLVIDSINKVFTSKVHIKCDK
ncbi:hypothetical protein BC826DRAFT_971320 [Russula brevipes]|nr:hypothetical protein BC826DRAFT_971320 [Russula brevipes]